MRKFIKAVGIAALVLGCGVFANAGQVSVSISSTSSAYYSAPLMLQPRESLGYKITGTATGTVIIEHSQTGRDYSSTGVSSVNIWGSTTTGNINTDVRDFFRFRVTTITAGTFNLTLTDNDDFVQEALNLKGLPVLKVYDESVRLEGRQVFAPGYNGSSLPLATTTELTPLNLDRTFMLVTSTGGALTVGSLPTISTTSAVTGSLYIIQSTTATVTFSDNGTVAGTLLELGSTTRALGVGDILVLIYQGGKWWEMGFYNN
jgi:hypothetical protein